MVCTESQKNSFEKCVVFHSIDTLKKYSFINKKLHEEIKNFTICNVTFFAACNDDDDDDMVVACDSYTATYNGDVKAIRIDSRTIRDFNLLERRRLS